MSHHESISENQTDQGNESKKVSPIGALAAILLVILLVIIGTLLLGHSESPTEEEDAARAAVRIKNLSELQAADAVVLSGIESGHMPITKAMEMIVPILNAKSAAASTTITVQKQP
jgi:hypothetical protein